jgi:MFS family permease
LKSKYSNPNVKWILIAITISSIGQSILWFSSTWLIYGLGGSNTDLGEILGTAIIIGLFASLALSSLADKYRKDVIIWVGGVFVLGGSFLLATSNNLSEVFVAQIILNIGNSALFPILGALFADSIQAEHRNKIFGTQFLLSNTSAALGNIVGYFIFQDADSKNIETLDVSLIKFSIFVATITLGFAFACTLFLRDKNTVKEADEGTVASNFIREHKDTKPLIKQNWYRFNRRFTEDFPPGSLKILLLSLTSAYLIGLGAGISIPYFPRFFFDIYHIDLANLSILFAFMTIITAFWGKINANLADKFGRVELIVANQFISVSLLVLLATYPPLIFALLTLIVRNAAMNGVGPVATAIQMEYAPRKYRSKVNALNMIAWALLFSIGQIIGGRLVDNFDFWLPILITASLYFVATIFYWKIRDIASKINLTQVP